MTSNFFYTPTPDGIVKKKRLRNELDEDSNSDDDGRGGIYERSRRRSNVEQVRRDNDAGVNRRRNDDADRRRNDDAGRRRNDNDRRRNDDANRRRDRRAPMQFDRNGARRVLHARRDVINLFEEINTENSTAIAKIVYLRASTRYNNEACLYVIYRYNQKIIYRYKGVSIEMWDEIKASDSLGRSLLDIKNNCPYTTVYHIPTMRDLELLLRVPNTISSQFYDYMEENRQRYSIPIYENTLRDIFLKWKNDNAIDGCNFSDMRFRLQFDGVLVNDGSLYTFAFMKKKKNNKDHDALREEAEKDKGGLIVSSIQGFPASGFVTRNVTVNGNIMITNTGNTIRSLTAINNKNTKFSFDFNDQPILININESVTVNISFQSNTIGYNSDEIILKFDDAFSISRNVSINVGNEEIRELLKPSSNYTRAARKARPGRIVIDFNTGVKRPGGGTGRFVNDIDDNVQQYQNIDVNNITVIERHLESLPRNMTFRWSQLQHLCLYAEEIQYRNEMDEFRMENTAIRRIGGSKIVIVVPGLAESRPSLLGIITIIITTIITIINNITTIIIIIIITIISW